MPNRLSNFHKIRYRKIVKIGGHWQPHHNRGCKCLSVLCTLRDRHGCISVQRIST